MERHGGRAGVAPVKAAPKVHWLVQGRPACGVVGWCPPPTPAAPPTCRRCLRMRAQLTQLMQELATRG